MCENAPASVNAKILVRQHVCMWVHVCCVRDIYKEHMAATAPSSSRGERSHCVTFAASQLVHQQQQNIGKPMIIDALVLQGILLDENVIC